MTSSPLSTWQRVREAARHQPATLKRQDLPPLPGVYCWFREGRPVYVGVAAGAQGLRSRLWTHLDTGVDLSRSAFRRNVLEQLGIASVATAQIRPSVLTPIQVAPVNHWIEQCELAWLECRSSEEAKALEAALLKDFRPPLNRR